MVAKLSMSKGHIFAVGQTGDDDDFGFLFPSLPPSPYSWRSRSHHIYYIITLILQYGAGVLCRRRLVDSRHYFAVQYFVDFLPNIHPTHIHFTADCLPIIKDCFLLIPGESQARTLVFFQLPAINLQGAGCGEL